MRTIFPNKSRLFNYKLVSTSFGTKELYSAPGGWEDNGFKFARSLKYFGIFRSRSDSVLTFNFEARRFLKQILDSEGIEAQCQYIEEKYNFSTYQYETYFVGRIDFSTRKITRKTFEVTVIDSDFDTIIRNRSDIPVKLFELTSIDGFEIPGNTKEGINVILPGKEDLYLNSIGTVETLTDTNELIFAIPLSINYQQDSAIRNVFDRTVLDNVNGSFVVADRNFTMYCVGSGNYSISSITYDGDLIITLRRYNSSLVLQESIEVLNAVIDDGVQGEFNYSEQLSLIQGDFVILEMEFRGVSHINESWYQVQQLTNTVFAEIPTISVNGFMRFEAFSRVLQSLSGKTDPFRSSCLGRVDSEPYNYAEDGGSSLGLITNGRLIRQFPKDNTPLSCSLNELFDSISVTDYVGIGVDEINGDKKVVLEHIDYFFDERVILTIDNAKNISFEFANDFIYNSIKSGYEKLAYEQRDGILEYNNKSQWSTFIRSVKNELDLVSKYRADNAGINFAKQKLYSEFASTDTQYDEDNFMIDLVRGTNKIVNGDFEAWTTGVPDGWTLENGTLLEKIYLGNTRCRFDVLAPDGFLNTCAISQSIAVTEGDNFVLSFSYKFVSELLIFGIAGIVVEVGGYRLQQNGSWAIGTSWAVSLSGYSVKESELQSFDSFFLQCDPIPATGSMLIKITTLAAGFVIDDIFNGEGYMKARTNEGFDSIVGTVNDSKSYNIRYSPARIIRKWGSVIRAGLDKYDGSFIVYNRSDKNSNLVSQETGQDIIYENQNIRVSDLNQPRIDPNYITFEVPLTSQIISTINDKFVSDDKPKKYGIVKVRDEIDKSKYYYGWLWEVNSGAKTKQKQMILLQVNTNKLTPIE